MNEEENPVGSQPLFDDTTTEDSLESQNDHSSVGRLKNQSKSATSSCFDHKNHWLFKQRKVNTDVTVVKPPLKTLEEMNRDYDAMVLQIQRKQEKLPPAQWSQPIKSDPTVLMSDPIEYLFRNDTMKFNSRKLNLKAFRSLDNVSPLPIETSSFWQNPNPRYLSRRAKEKAKTNVMLSASQDLDADSVYDFDNQQTLKKLNPLRRKTKLIEPKPLPPSHPRLKLSKKTPVENEEVTSIEKNDDMDDQPKKKRKLASKDKNDGGFIRNILDFVKPTSKKEEPIAVDGDVEVVEIDEEHDGNKPLQDITKEKNKESQKQCPMCYLMFSDSKIGLHASDCQGPRSSLRSSSANNTPGYSTDWQEACKGLDETYVGKPPTKEEIITVDENNYMKTAAKNIFSERDNTSSNGNSKRTGNLRKTNKLVENSHAKYYNLEEIKCKNKNNKINSSRTVEEAQHMTDDESDTEILQGYVKTDVKSNILPKKVDRATGLRKFGTTTTAEAANSPDGIKLVCYRCSKHFLGSEEYKKHSEICLEQSSITSP